jgi:glycosyltransferase involved in cell wall biosynthesis
MSNLAILCISDFEDWNNQKSISIGGSSGVIKNILPYLNADRIFLMGVTSYKKNLYKEICLDERITILPLIYVPSNSKIPLRIRAFWGSTIINKILKKYEINSVYTHAEEMSFWIMPGYTIVYHMHGSTNALVKAKMRFFRNKIFQFLWEYVRNVNIRNSTKIITIDNLCYKLVEKQNNKEKALLIPNFVDTKVFYKSSEVCALLSHIKDKILVFVGRIEEVKGLELFVQTVIELNRRGQGKWKGVIVGKGSYESNIRKYITFNSVDDFFYFTGAIFDSNELRKIYNRANILMISSYFEGIPMAILESIACGTPVVSTDVGGIKEFVADGIMCLVEDRRYPSEFASLILSLSCKNVPEFYHFRFSAAEISYILNGILSK